MNGAAFVLSCAILLVLQQETIGLTCYTCSAGTDGCGMKFSSTGGGVWTSTMFASASATACQKIVYDGNTNAQTRSAATACVAGSSTTSTGGSAITTYCCTTDLCNGVQPTRANLAIATTVAVISVLLIK